MSATEGNNSHTKNSTVKNISVTINNKNIFQDSKTSLRMSGKGKNENAQGTSRNPMQNPVINLGINFGSLISNNINIFSCSPIVGYGNIPKVPDLKPENIAAIGTFCQNLGLNLGSRNAPEQNATPGIQMPEGTQPVGNSVYGNYDLGAPINPPAPTVQDLNPEFQIPNVIQPAGNLVYDNE